MHRTVLLTLFLLSVATASACAQTSSQLQGSQLERQYPSRQRVYATSARASSTYGAGHTAQEATGRPNVFPRHRDTKGAWACKDKNSKQEWLAVGFPPTEARALIVLQTFQPGAISRILADGEVVYQSAKVGSVASRALGLCVTFPAPRTVKEVRIEVVPSAVRGWPEIDAVALVPVASAATPPRRTAKPPRATGSTRGDRRRVRRPSGGAAGTPKKTPAAPAKPAIGRGQRWGAEAFAARTKGATLVYANAAGASSSRGKQEHSPVQACGAPNAFPKLGKSAQAWSPKSNATQDYLDLAFPKTAARWVYVFENEAPGTIRAIGDQTGAILYRNDAPPRPRYIEGQVLCVELPEAREIERLRIVVDSKLNTNYRAWVGIDAVGLGNEAPSPERYVSKRPLDKDDQHYYERAAPAVARLAERLANHRGSVFKGGDAQVYATSLASRRQQVDKIADHSNAQVVALLEQLDAIEAKLKNMKQQARAAQAELGPESVTAARSAVKEFIAGWNDRGASFFPAIPERWGEAGFRAYGAELKASVQELERKRDLIKRVSAWSDQKLGEVGRALKCAQLLQSQATAPIQRARKKALEARSIDVSGVTVKQLRDAAWGRSLDRSWHLLEQAAKGMRSIVAFEEAYHGRANPESVAARDQLVPRFEGLDQRIDAQIASERLPTGGNDAKLLGIAKGLLRDTTNLVVTAPMETKKGRWTQRDLINTQDYGAYVKKTYRVIDQPYKYDRFWVAIARPDPKNPAYVQVHEFGIRYYEYGGQPLKKWHLYSDQRKFVMLKANLPR